LWNLLYVLELIHEAICLSESPIKQGAVSQRKGDGQMVIAWIVDDPLQSDMMQMFNIK
jgi:hypothetical protein